VQNWKEALAAALTHAATEELSSLCAFLGQRLLAQGNNKYDIEFLTPDRSIKTFNSIQEYFNIWNTTIAFCKPCYISSN
jgi:hypothetical protein